MYKYDSDLEIAGLELRLFVEYSKTIEDLYGLAMLTSAQVHNYQNMHTASVVKTRSNKYQRPYHPDDTFLDLIAKEDYLWKKYKWRVHYIDQVSKRLRDLPKEDLDLLYLHYEKKYTLRAIGDMLNYSHMQISRMIDEILRKLE